MTGVVSPFAAVPPPSLVADLVVPTDVKAFADSHDWRDAQVRFIGIYRVAIPLSTRQINPSQNLAGIGDRSTGRRNVQPSRHIVRFLLFSSCVSD